MLRTFLIASLVALLAAPVSANLYLDEGFEDGTPFTNNAYPVQDVDTTAASLTPTGLNIRCYDAAHAAAPQFAVSNGGTVVSTAAYSGSSGLELASGQSVAVDNSGGVYYGRGENNHIVMQFALSFPESVFSLAAGTQVGHYAQEWDTDAEATSAIELTYQLNFVRNATGGVDIIVNNNSVVAHTVTSAGDWVVITVVGAKAQDPTYSNGYPWVAWDPFTLMFKGPQPTGGDPATGLLTIDQAIILACGIHLYVNSNTDTDFILNTDLGATPTWSATDGTKGDTRLIFWELVAENGGTLLVDDMYYSIGYLQGVRTPTAGEATQPPFLSQEMCSRLLDFVGPGIPPVSGANANTWTLFE